MRQDGTKDMSPPDNFKWTIGRTVEDLDWVHEAELCILEIQEKVKAIKSGNPPSHDFYD